MEAEAYADMHGNLKKAVGELHAFSARKAEKRKEGSCCPSKDKFELFVTFAVPPQDHYIPTVVKVPFKKSLGDVSCCIFVADGKKAALKEQIQNCDALKGVTIKVLEIHSFREKYASLPRKKELQTKYKLFMVDESVNRRILLSLLGKVFLQRHFELFSADISAIDRVVEGYKAAMSSACINWKGKPMLNIPIGSMCHTADELVENAKALLGGVMEKSSLDDIESIMVGECRYNNRLFIYAHDFIKELAGLPDTPAEPLVDIAAGDLPPVTESKQVKRKKRKV